MSMFVRSSTEDNQIVHAEVAHDETAVLHDRPATHPWRDAALRLLAASALTGAAVLLASWPTSRALATDPAP
ncbi:MAG TPA: hypothetical protein VIQ29_14945, partial [Ancylobacter sp.]